MNLILSFVKTFIFKTDKNTENKKYKHKKIQFAFFDYIFLFQQVAARGIGCTFCANCNEEHKRIFNKLILIFQTQNLSWFQRFFNFSAFSMTEVEKFKYYKEALSVRRMRTEVTSSTDQRYIMLDGIFLQCNRSN